MTRIDSAQTASPLSLTSHTERPSTYTVQRGDTLSGIAVQQGVKLADLEQSNPDLARNGFIFPGDVLVIPGQSHTDHIVQPGETLSGIAHAAGTTWQALARTNKIENPDLIRTGQHLSMPANETVGRSPHALAPRAQSTTSPTTSPTRAGQMHAVEPSGLHRGTLTLSAQDIVNVKKTLTTEWVPFAGEAQAHGIIDTLLNRQASGHWGKTVSEVVNARNQFSDINGPIARNQHGRNSVEQFPASSITARVDQLVNRYLAQRASGTPSSVGDNLNYANPNYSDAKNQAWIRALDGPHLGRGDAIHYHGTTPELQQYRPGPFAIRLL